MERTVAARPGPSAEPEEAEVATWLDAPPPDTSRHWTSADLEAVPQPWDDTRYEIIKGTLYVSTQPSIEHQYTCSQVVMGLERWNDTTQAGIALPAIGLIFAGDDNAAPDAVWYSWERFRAARGEDDKLHAAPELVVEVLSPGAQNTQRDRVVKLDLYSRRGVQEYWIVSTVQRLVEVYRRSEAMPELLRLVGTVRETERVESPLLPGFSLPVSRLFLRAG